MTSSRGLDLPGPPGWALWALASVAAVLVGCRTPPPPHPAVEAARQAVQQAGANPHVVRGGTVELGLARADLARADVAWREDRDEGQTKHYAHLAHQRALIAGQIGLQLEAESKLAQAAQQREQLRADAVRRGAAVVAAAPPAAAPNAAPVAPRVLTPAPQTPSTESPPLQAPATAPSSAQPAPSQPPSPAPTAPQAQRPAAPPAASRFDAETAARARTEVDGQRGQADTARSGRATAPPPAPAAGAERDAALRQQLQQMQARDTQRGMVLTLPDVLFESGGAALKPGSERTLEQIVALMRRFPERRVLLEGFTDDVGPETVNYDLSQRRAEAFRNALLARGADARRIDVSAQGEAFPVARNDTAAGRAQNRRVEVIFSDEQGRFAPR